MVYPLVQVVSSPGDAGMVVRYDFHIRDATTHCHPLDQDGLDLGTPTFTGDPDSVGGQYGYRELKLVQRIEGTRAAALGKMSTLAKELLRSTVNWVKIQWNSDVSPVYFRVYRTQPGALSLAQATDAAQAYDLTVQLDADPFAYMARVTLGTVTLANSLAAGNPMRYVIPALKGDAPTGLRVKVTPQGTNGYMASVLMALVAADSAVTDTVIDVGTGDVWTAGTNTGADVVSASYLGGSYRLASVTASDLVAGSNFSNRLSGTLAAAPPPGRYKVMLRCEVDPFGVSSPTNLIFALGQMVGGAYRYGNTVAKTTPTVTPGHTTAESLQGWVDLGDFTFPFGNALPPDVASSAPAPQLSLKVGTSDNRGTAVRLDCLKLIPITSPLVRRTTLLKSDFESNVINYVSPATGPYISVSATWDADAETFWGNAVSGGALVEGQPAMQGAFPIADPAATQNLLIFMPTARGRSAVTDAGTAAAATWTVDISYYPKFLYIGDGT